MFRSIAGHFALAIALAGGCAEYSPPWEATSSDAAHAAELPGARVPAVIAVLPLTDPATSTPGWSNIGVGMGRAIANRIAQRPDLRAQLDRDASGLAGIEPDSSAFTSGLDRFRIAHPEADYLIVGGIVDFRHVNHKPTDLSAWNTSRNRSEAQVVLQLRMYDLHTLRTVFSNRFEGSAWIAQDTTGRTGDPYRGISFGSNRFADTPLGLATRDVLGRVSEAIGQAIPPAPERLSGR